VNKKYPTDITDSQWHHIKDFFPVSKTTGRPREVDFREFYILSLPVVSGGLFRASIRRGKRFTVIFELGKRMGRGIEYTKLCALMCGAKKDGTNIRRQAVLIHNQ
jgi:transposase